jgi:transaldolase/glucose-6-phosphate isomerase
MEIPMPSPIDSLRTQDSQLIEAVRASLMEWQAEGKVGRLWNKDASLWSGQDEAKWLDWLTIVDSQLADDSHLRRIANDVQGGGFQQVVVLGMGGSSLCPEVLRKTFGVVAGFPELHVLDSMVPAQVTTLRRKLNLARTLFIVASKSGSTLEPNAFKQYFYEEVRRTVGDDKVGSHFVAVTDPGTKMNEIATAGRFRQVFFGRKEIGGRYSALSNFGMIPAAAMGLNVREFLERTRTMVRACGPETPAAENPGVVLGAIIGTAAKRGRDKLTIIASPAIGSLGAWLEQLIAESTGKLGQGIVPVDDERLGSPSVYGGDRLFVYVRLTSNPNSDQDAAVTALERSGQPVVRIDVAQASDLGKELFRWEIATAVAGSILGINPFDQPDVEAAKVAARSLSDAYETSGVLPEEKFFAAEGDLRLQTDPTNEMQLRKAARGDEVASILAAHLNRLCLGDYFAINAYVAMNAANQRWLSDIRHAVRDAKRVATTLGFGPRFLHSTGQLHKGGPNSGVFLQITSDDAADLPIPGMKSTFGLVKRFQAQGDFDVLATRRRRALRVHLGTDVEAGLAMLRDRVAFALRN